MDFLVLLLNVYVEVHNYTRYVARVPISENSATWPEQNLLKILGGETGIYINNKI